MIVHPIQFRDLEHSSFPVLVSKNEIALNYLLFKTEHMQQLINTRSDQEDSVMPLPGTSCNAPIIRSRVSRIC